MRFDRSLDKRLASVRLFAFDVDGVLTDGGLYLSDSAEEEILRFHVQDGAGIAAALRAGYPVAWITGRRSEAVRRRAQMLGVEELHLGAKDKVAVLEDLAQRHNLRIDEVGFMGDDLPDLPAMKIAGCAAAPANAAPDVREHAHFLSRAAGGNGAAREFIEAVIRAQGRWDEVLEAYLTAEKRLQ